MKKYFFPALFSLSVLINASVASAATFTIDQIASHNSASDCYMVVDSRVYDITAYFGQHPGGDRTLLDSCGTDATQSFATMGGKGRDHSQKAYSMLEGYYIGDLGNAVTTGDSGNKIAAAVPDTTPTASNQSLLGRSGTSPATGPFSAYPLVIPIFIVWVLMIIIFRLLCKKNPVIFNKGLFMRITALTQMIAFLIVAAGGIYMTLFGRVMIGTFDPIILHVYLGFTFTLAALTHISLHRKEIMVYLAKLLVK